MHCFDCHLCYRYWVRALAMWKTLKLLIFAWLSVLYLAALPLLPWYMITFTLFQFHALSSLHVYCRIHSKLYHWFKNYDLLSQVSTVWCEHESVRSLITNYQTGHTINSVSMLRVIERGVLLLVKYCCEYHPNSNSTNYSKVVPRVHKILFSLRHVNKKSMSSHTCLLI